MTPISFNDPRGKSWTIQGIPKKMTPFLILIPMVLILERGLNFSGYPVYLVLLKFKNVRCWKWYWFNFEWYWIQSLP